MQLTYQSDIRLTSYDVGPTRELKYSMILRLLQEAAGCQLEDAGLSYEFMRDRGAVFLLTSVGVSIRSLPHAGDTVRVETWFSGNSGAQYVRDMRITGDDGSPCAELESLWTTVDPQSHRIIRPSALPFAQAIPSGEGGVAAAAERHILRDAGEPDLQDAGVRVVRWSDIDCNGHMNNAVYADLICDYYPGGLGSRRLTGFSISFLGEAEPGDSIRIRTAEEPGNDAFFAGLIGERRCFEARACVQP